ncbi:hypothetical protein RFI_23432 [Reticulomyxa filosa]|uniref:Uncharacterized protein n=1 Tax=Reticulomyxa filosa TaxID=46433 RepID=X6MJX7_RETFI|nr:hypothetical protein RFI_23432 [Reticulomyxa filosa]|eukprot:ETO13936.1 hypothetical protein RFI_23432 [Reticulomyxa filosa]
MGCDKALESYQTPWSMFLLGCIWQLFLFFVIEDIFRLRSNHSAASDSKINRSDKSINIASQKDKYEPLMSSTTETIQAESITDRLKMRFLAIARHRWFNRIKTGLVIYETIAIMAVTVTDVITFADYMKANRNRHSNWNHYQCYAQIFLSSSNGKTIVAYWSLKFILNATQEENAKSFALSRAGIKNLCKACLSNPWQGVYWCTYICTGLFFYVPVYFTHAIPGLAVYSPFWLFSYFIAIVVILLVDRSRLKSQTSGLVITVIMGFLAVLSAVFSCLFFALVMAEFYHGANWWAGVELVWNRRTWAHYLQGYYNTWAQLHSFLQLITMIF